MSLINRVKKLFSPKEPEGILAVSLQQKTVQCCHTDKAMVVTCFEKELPDNNVEKAFESLAGRDEFSGQTHLILSGKQQQIVQIDKPKLADEEIVSALPWQIKDLVSFAPENMVVDYVDLPIQIAGANKINVVCTAKDNLSAWVSSLVEQELSLKSITAEEFAFAALPPVSEDAKLLLCQQPNEEVLILIVKQGMIYFQRRLRGMAQIGSKTQEELAFGTLDSLSLEIQRSTDYYERQLKQAPIKAIDVLLPIENEAFIARKLAENTHIPVNLFTMPEGYEQHREFAACIGATRLASQMELTQ